MLDAILKAPGRDLGARTPPRWSPGRVSAKFFFGLFGGLCSRAVSGGFWRGPGVDFEGFSGGLEVFFGSFWKGVEEVF